MKTKIFIAFVLLTASMAVQGEDITMVQASSYNKVAELPLQNNPKLVIGATELLFTDGTNSTQFSADERVVLRVQKILGVYNLSTGAQSGDDYYGTFSSSHAVQFSDEAIVYAVNVNDGNLIVTEVTSKQVPANTGVLVKSTTNSATYSFIASAASIENNLLRPSGDAGITAANMDAANTKFYRLTMHNGTQIGFWWGAENGAAFNLAANKAYLAVPSVSLAKSFMWFEKDDEDAINVVNADAAKDAIYNLSGQRMNRLQKGINISNNKKIVVR